MDTCETTGMRWDESQGSWIDCMKNPEVGAIEQQSGNGGWLSSALGFGSSLLNNSGSLASIFSPSYRENQLAMANAQNQGGAKNGTLSQTSNNTWIIIGVVVLVIIILFVLLKKKK